MCVFWKVYEPPLLPTFSLFDFFFFSFFQIDWIKVTSFGINDFDKDKERKKDLRILSTTPRPSPPTFSLHFPVPIFSPFPQFSGIFILNLSPVVNSDDLSGEFFFFLFRFFTIFQAHRFCWQITIHFTVLCSREWIACSSSWVTRPNPAGKG